MADGVPFPRGSYGVWADDDDVIGLTIELDILESCRRGGRWHGGDSSVSAADQSSLSRGWFGSEPSACALSAPDAMDVDLSGGKP